MKYVILLVSFMLMFLFFAEAVLYEDQIYFSILLSFVQDLDFNIINQIPKDERWIVTRTGFYPSHHSELQTSILVIFYYLEKVIRFFLNEKTYSSAVAVGLCANIISLLLSFKLSKKLNKLLGVRESVKATTLFFLGTCTFYFSFFEVNVIEVFVMPITFFTLIEYLKIVRGRTISWGWLGLSVGLLVSSKSLYFLLLMFLLGEIYIQRKKYCKKNIANFLVNFLIPVLIFNLNNYVKNGQVDIYTKGVFDILMELSLINFLSTMRTGLFTPGGLFFVNPPFLISILGLILFFREKKSMPEGRFIIFQIIWIMQLLFLSMMFIGPILDDHYNGRMFLVVFPALYVGFLYFVSHVRVRSIVENVFLMIGIAWQFYLMFSFMTIMSKGHYSYALEKMISLSELFNRITRNCLILHNYIEDSYLYIFFLSFILVLICYSFDKLKIREKNLLKSYIGLVIGFYMIG
ncbi:hypothetical protein OAT67_04565, partial [Bacteriovoracaceae bacterium]|nr:hypothetical protein [Bacteriovoracaceae bacterium]